MRFDANDRAALLNITPREARAYLVSQGWKDIRRILDRAVIFEHHTDERKWEIPLPLRTNLADYAERMAEAISILSKVEQRTETEVYRDVTIIGDDVLRLRAREADAQGTIKLQDGVVLYQQAQNLLLAAACAAVRPQASYHARKMNDAVKYLDNVRLGQTERGSYVLTLLSPVAPTLKRDQQSLIPAFEDEPFSRQVTWMLAISLEAVRTALTETSARDDFVPFEQAVQSGVSANLCEAVADLSGHGNGIDIRLTWAQTRPASNLPQYFQFERHQVDILKEVAREFRRNAPRLDESFIGHVTRLDRSIDDFDGDATVQTILDNRPKAIRVRFPEAQYKDVIHAFENKLGIMLEGDLYPAGQRFELKNPRNLIVLESEDEPILSSEER